MGDSTQHMNRVVCSWSGGIDSTGVVANLLRRGYDVRAITYHIYGRSFGAREARARAALKEVFATLGGHFEHHEEDADWIWAFSPDGVEIPRRNKHLIDRLALVECARAETHNLGMGEYVGADTWLVADHVAAADADARSLTAYLYAEYGMGYRLFTLADFGESRYKVNRLRLCYDAIGEAVNLTSVCLRDFDRHCGQCYKCIERAAAFDLAGYVDETVYLEDPRRAANFGLYLAQMKGLTVNVSYRTFPHDRMPVSASQGMEAPAS